MAGGAGRNHGRKNDARKASLAGDGRLKKQTPLRVLNRGGGMIDVECVRGNGRKNLFQKPAPALKRQLDTEFTSGIEHIEDYINDRHRAPQLIRNFFASQALLQLRKRQSLAERFA